MAAITERARQALGVGSESFAASSLEAHQSTLAELEVCVGPLKAMLKATKQFEDDTKEFLDASSHYMQDVPFPRLWSQTSPMESAQPLHTPAPAEQAALFDAETHASLAENVPTAVSYAIRKELIGPMEQWLLAYEVAQGSLSTLEGRRLPYDAARRRLVSRAEKVAAAAAGSDVALSSTERGQQQAEVTLVTGGPELASLQEEAAAASGELSSYEADVEALQDHLTWLVGGAARLKALLADAAGGAAAAARAWQVPPGIMPVLESTSRVGEDVEVSLSLTEAPLGAAPAAESSITSLASPSEGLLVGSTAARAAGGGREEGKDSAPPAPDFSATYPSDAMVYGGGVAPGPTATQPDGGGVTELIKDTLLPPSSSSSQQQEHRAPTTPAADVSGTLPSDEMVYAGGVAPSPAGTTARPEGGGVTELIKDTLLPVDTSALAAAQAAAEEAKDESQDIGLLEALHQRSRGTSSMSSFSSEDFEGVEQLPELPASAAADAPEVFSRPTRSYSGEGVGRVEARLPDSSAMGLGAAGRRLSRSASDGEKAGLAGPGLAMRPEVQVAEPEKKQLSTVVLPTSPTAAAAAGTTFSTNEGTRDLPTTGQAAAAAGEPTAAAAGGGAAPESVGGGGGGGLLAAIAKTITDNLPSRREAVGTPAAAATGTGASSGEEPVGQEVYQQHQPAEQGEEAGEGEKGGNLFEVQGAEASGTPGAPGTAASVGGVNVPVGEVGPGPEAHGDMHIGPVAPFPGADLAPGTAVFVKGPTPPGGAAAVTHTAAEVPAAAAAAAAEVPAAEVPAAEVPAAEVPAAAAAEEPAAAAAQEPAAGSAPAESTAAGPAAEAPAGPGGEVGGAAAAASPDLSKMLPRHEKLTTGTSARPSGGGVGTFIKDTLFGPAHTAGTK